MFYLATAVHGLDLERRGLLFLPLPPLAHAAEARLDPSRRLGLLADLCVVAAVVVVSVGVTDRAIRRPQWALWRGCWR
jgi:hypothetical protein